MNNLLPLCKPVFCVRPIRYSRRVRILPSSSHSKGASMLFVLMSSHYSLSTKLSKICFWELMRRWSTSGVDFYDFTVAKKGDKVEAVSEGQGVSNFLLFCNRTGEDILEESDEFRCVLCIAFNMNRLNWSSHVCCLTRSGFPWFKIPGKKAQLDPPSA